MAHKTTFQDKNIVHPSNNMSWQEMQMMQQHNMNETSSCYT